MSEFYERKRRLAYILAGLAFFLMFVGFYLGFFIEQFGDPAVAADPDRVHLLYRAQSSDEKEAQSRLFTLDPGFLQRQSYRLYGDFRALVAEGSEVTAFFGTRYMVLREGQTVRGADLGQTWPVQAAVTDPQSRQPWIFGWSKGKIVARKFLGVWSEEFPVADVPGLERLRAAADGARGPLVSWRETGSTKINCLLYDGRGFKPFAEFDPGAVRHWDVAFADGRALLFYYDRNDRSFSSLSLRVRCCPGCGRPPPPEKVTFDEPFLLIGRYVTGLAVGAAPERLHLVVTRQTTVQGASLPLPELGGGRLVPLGAVPLWRRVGAALLPVTMLFFSFSLVFLGFTLLRERGRSLLEMIRPADEKGPPTAEILQRAMAHILDSILLIPVFAAATEILNVAPETTVFDLADPKWRGFIATWIVLTFTYHFVLEWLTGRTAGKRIIGIRVVELDGSRLGFRGALVRNLVRLLDAEYPLGVFLGTSFLMATARRQRLGDLWGRTLVVQDRPPARSEEEMLQPPRRRL